MHHDFHRSPSDVRRDKSGKACYGYMDYKQDTNYWSTCSVEFLTGQNKSCLKKIGGGTTQDPVTTRPGKLSCYFIDYLLTSLLILSSFLDHYKTFKNFLFGAGTEPCEDDKNYGNNCKKFAWACTDSRYPWFRNTCKSTCKNC